MRALTVICCVCIGMAAIAKAEPAGGIPRGAWVRSIGDVPASCQSNCPKRGVALGGFGSGSFMYNYCGSFGPWADEVGNYKQTWLTGAAFHFYERYRDSVTTKCLCTEASLMPSAWDCMATGEGAYYALQPMGWCDYSCFACKVSSMFFSPVIPHNSRETSYPVAVWQFKLINSSPHPKEVSVMLTWPDPPFSGGSQVRAGFTNTVRDSLGAVGIVLKASDPSNTPETQNSEWCIASSEMDGCTVSCASWSISGDGSDIWSQFSDNGVLSGIVNPLDSAAAIAVKTILPPGDSVIIPFVISWDFPVVEFKSNYGTGQSTQWWKRYCEYFDTLSDNSFDMALEALNNYQSWEDQIDAWMSQFVEDPRYPDWMLCAGFNELYYNQFGGSFWESGLRSGHPQEFMGLHPEDHKNFIMECHAYTLSGNINVGHYSSIVYAKFWPEMERDLLRCHADIVLHYDECNPTVPNQTSPEIGAPRNVMNGYCYIGDPFFVMDAHRYLIRSAPCADGNVHVLTDNSSKFIQRCWRYYSLYQDMEFLEYVWPAVESTYHYMMSYDCEAEPKDSLPYVQGYDNAYDGWRMVGTDMYAGGFWVGALEAMDTMAAILAKPVRPEVHAWLEAAKRNLDAELWDSTGQYYRIDTGSEYPTAVFSDALCGQRYCESFGLPDILPLWKMQAHLRKVYEVNVVPNSNFGARLGRMPNGSTVPTHDRDTYEYWVGTTYYVAAQMYHAGLKNEALNTAYGAYYPVYQADNLAYWFNTPEAWRDNGLHPRPTSTSAWTTDHPSLPAEVEFLVDEDKDSRAYPHQYQRARAIWELMFEIKKDPSFYQVGDVNSDGMIDLSDVIYLLNYLYKNGPPPVVLEAADCNCDGTVDIGDVVYLLNYLFKNGPQPHCW
jgi:non-lysosomal glucosylceramidase